MDIGGGVGAGHVTAINHNWNPNQRYKPPGAFGQRLNNVRFKQPQGTVDWGVDPLLIVAAHPSNLWQQGSRPVDKLLVGKNK